jgi:UV DNA damage endonuclease
LPPCPNDMDLMIEAKDKEQAAFELMRTFRLPGWDTFNNIIPHERSDDNKPLPKRVKKKKTKKQIAAEIEEFGKELSEEEEAVKNEVPEEEIGMGGKENRVYWPVGMEEWLRPKKREVKKKGFEDEKEMLKNSTPPNFEARRKVIARNKEPLSVEVRVRLKEAGCVADVQRILQEVKEEKLATEGEVEVEKPKNSKAMAVKKEGVRKMATVGKKRTTKNAPAPSLSNIEEEDEGEDLSMPDLSEEDEKLESSVAAVEAFPARRSGRGGGKRTSYAEVDGLTEEE